MQDNLLEYFGYVSCTTFILLVPITESTIIKIQAELKNNNIIAAGDGSVTDGRGAQAWCIVTKNEHRMLLKGASCVQGDPLRMTSMRPETVSSITTGTFLNLIANPIKDQLTNIDVTFYSDNESTVINSQRPHLHDVGKVLENDIDVTIQNV